jgi:hypothetical protein
MFFGEIIVVFCTSHKKTYKTQCGENAESVLQQVVLMGNKRLHLNTEHKHTCKEVDPSILYVPHPVR